MLEFLGNTKRSDYCGDLRIDDIGKTVTVCGWVQRQRDLGNLIFIDLRDRSGIVQLAFDENTDKGIFEKAFACRSEYVLAATGIVRERSAKNMEIPTGEIEIQVIELKLLSKSKTPPFEILPNSQTSELTRLKYRYLDLRRPDLQSNILLRNRIMKVTRDYFYDNGFIEIETPILIKSSPEGARDFLVPSRLHPGSFYALPQSPQIYKQLSMVAGFDRYIQLARSFRDEDSRADRQPEFTQIDMEMSFVDVDDVLSMVEGYMHTLFKEVLGTELKIPFNRMTYNDAMEKYGSDKPDLRYGLELVNISDIIKDSEFSVFSSAVKSGGSVRAINAKNSASILTRKEIDKLTETAKGIGAKGLAWIRWVEDKPSSSFGKFLTEDEMNGILKALGAEQGDVMLFVADTKNSLALSVCGAVRTEVAKKIGIIKDEFCFSWIVEMPFFDWDDETEQYLAMHHPFTSPMDDSLKYLDSDKSKVKAKAYDLVLNGVELLSGSIRITNPDLQSKIFDLLGLSDEEARMKFGYLLEAFEYGAPPHGGVGIGLDRLVMQMVGADSLRDVLAFPKLKDATESMTKCPSPVDKSQLDELHICLNSDVESKE